MEDLIFENTITTTKTFVIKIQNFDPDINLWFNSIVAFEDSMDPSEIPKKWVDAHHILPGTIIRKKRSNFKNCFTIKMVNDRCLIDTIKICKKGSLHVTGCREISSCEFCTLALLRSEECRKEWYTFPLKIIIIPVMVNKKFDIGMPISIIKAIDTFNSDIFFAYKLRINPAVNIKRPVSIEDALKISLSTLVVDGETIVRSVQSYGEYIEHNLGVEEKKKFMEKKRFVTFILFRSGSVILSGMDEPIISEAFAQFREFILTNQGLLN